MSGIINNMLKSERQLKIFCYITILSLGVAARFIPHPPNFTPLGALALMSGFLFPRSIWAFLLPVLSLGISDLFLGHYPGMGFTYFAFALVFILGCAFQNIKAPAWFGLGLSSSLIFFLVSNFGVWISTQMYAPNLEGLGLCYAAALPFLKWTVLGDLSFLFLFQSIRSAFKYLPQIYQQTTLK